MKNDSWPWRLEGNCTIVWTHDPAPKSGTCNLVRMPDKVPSYVGDVDLAEWDGRETPRGVLRFDDIELDVSSSRFRVNEGDEPQRVTLFVSSNGAPRRFSDLR